MKISIKFGIWFFFCILLVEVFSMFFLHHTLVNSQVEQELQALQARGNSHRDILEMNTDAATLYHIGLMESHTDTEIVIMNTNGKILLSSSNVDHSMQKILKKPIKSLPRNGRIIQSDWKNVKYISTVTEINKNGKKFGYVYMFKKTDEVQRLISELNSHFLIASILIFFLMLIIIFILSNVLTKPIILMINATKNLRKGDFSVSLPPPSNDELGELSQSIQVLANDLYYLKKERNEFLASISHELRTPLTYIHGYADIARRAGIDEAERSQFLNIIYEESERVSKLLKELFELAKLDQNSFSITKETIDICDFLSSIRQKVLPAFKNKGIQLEYECSQNLYVDLDPARFEQVIFNLLDNSLKYSKEGTTTTLKASEKSGNIHISITDQGEGIPQEDLPYVFDRLYRVDKSRSRATGGFGLGLAIVKQLVEANGGEISAESNPNQGTCFQIVLKHHI